MRFFMKGFEKGNFVLVTLSGSHAYGMDTDKSDIDIKGTFIAPLEYYIGSKSIELIDNKVYLKDLFYEHLSDNLKSKAVLNGFEGTVYDLRKFLKLAAGGNPNILDILFTRDCDVLYMTEQGKQIRDNRNAFLTKKCLNTFFGYASAQAKKIETHRKWLLNPLQKKPERKDFGLPERSEIPQDQIMAATAEIKKTIDSWSIDYGDIDEATKIYVEDQIMNRIRSMKIGTTDSDKFKIAGNLLGFETNFMKLIVSQREYDCAINNWNSFLTWQKERNVSRRELESKVGYDAKHAAHLYRLIVACKSIFVNGELSVYNPNPLIMDIRNCNVSYDKFMEIVEDEKQNISQIAMNSSLPSSVSNDWIEDFCLSLMKDFHKIG